MSTNPGDKGEGPGGLDEVTKTELPATEPKPPVAAICPKCGLGKLRVTGFKANSERPTFQMGQSSVYAHGRDHPSVTVKCINPACSYMAERPGSHQMTGHFYPVL